MAVSRTVTGDDDMAQQGTPFRRIRMDEDPLGTAGSRTVPKRADPDSNCLLGPLRRFAWLVCRRHGREMPRHSSRRRLSRSELPGLSGTRS